MNDMTSSAFNEPSQSAREAIVEPGMEREFLGMLLKNLDIGVAILDRDMRYRMLSSATLTRMQINEGDIELGDPLSKMHDVMAQNGLMTPEIMKKNALSEFEHRNNAATGTKTTSQLVKLGDGTTHRFCRQVLNNGYTISVASDVSELVEKDLLLQEALTMGRSGIWTYDFKTKKYALSQSLHDYFGPELTEKIQKSGFIYAVAPEHRDLLRDKLKNIAKTGDGFEITKKCITRTGKMRWGKTVAELVRDEHGRPLRIRAFVQDTEREHRQQEEIEAAKDEAIQASKAKSEFLANMSHEIRTPMNGILGMAELLALSKIDDRQREYVDVITSSASALLCIINDILDFSKIEAGALHLDPTPFNLKSSINDVTSLLIANAQEKGLELIIDYSSSLPNNFIGDAGRIRQILTNLIGNAIKFTAEGYVKIKVDMTPSDTDPEMQVITLDVTDTGIGIAPDALEAVFDKFTQADGSTTRVYGGTGLGLAITKKIAEMMDGEIHVRSEVGVGSTFGVTIPLPVDKAAKVEAFDIAGLDGKHALIVDDLAVNCTILTDQIAGWGMTSHAVHNGVEAAEALKSVTSDPNAQAYDVILMDYLMPGVNGRELASMLSKQSSVAVPPIVMLSSCDQSVSSQDLAEIGINTYLIKPVRERRLFETLGRVLGKPSVSKPVKPLQAKTSPAVMNKGFEPVRLEAAPDTIESQPSQPTPISTHEVFPPAAIEVDKPVEVATVDQTSQPVQSIQPGQPGQPEAPDPAMPGAINGAAVDDSLLDSMFADLAATASAPSASAPGKPVPTASIPAPNPDYAPIQSVQTPTAPQRSPAPLVPAQPPAVEPISETQAPAGKQEILVAEDFPLNRDVVRLMLVESAFEPVFAENGKLASELYTTEPDRFPLVLMDISMPVMDGFQATKVIRDWEASQGRSDAPVPIIALTGHALKNDRQECLDAGMDHYLTKPVKQTELLEVLERFSGRAVKSSRAA